MKSFYYLAQAAYEAYCSNMRDFLNTSPDATLLGEDSRTLLMCVASISWADSPQMGKDAWIAATRKTVEEVNQVH